MYTSLATNQTLQYNLRIVARQGAAAEEGGDALLCIARDVNCRAMHCGLLVRPCAMSPFSPGADAETWHVTLVDSESGYARVFSDYAGAYQCIAWGLGGGVEGAECDPSQEAQRVVLATADGRPIEGQSIGFLCMHALAYLCILIYTFRLFLLRPSLVLHPPPPPHRHEIQTLGLLQGPGTIEILVIHAREFIIYIYIAVRAP
jgi:hypothetical protein